ncbi:MAG: hypothetical protein Q8S84_05050 [bacterium]|nr:hypothetical protein [bacterium]MDP3380862.1 hypothetical protein [bacterium]
MIISLANTSFLFHNITSNKSLFVNVFVKNHCNFSFHIIKFKSA